MTEKRTPKTNKGKYNALVRKAATINEKLRRLQKEAEELADACFNFCENDFYDAEIKTLQCTAEDLASFDFEDSVPEYARYNF